MALKKQKANLVDKNKIITENEVIELVVSVYLYMGYVELPTLLNFTSKSAEIMFIGW
jgi:hypothetical protein